MNCCAGIILVMSLELVGRKKIPEDPAKKIACHDYTAIWYFIPSQ